MTPIRSTSLAILLALPLLAGCGSGGTPGSPSRTPQYRALIAGPVSGPVVDALLPHLSIELYDGTQDPADFDLALLDGGYLSPDDLDDGARADELVDRSLFLGIPVLLVRASAEESRLLTEEQWIWVESPSAAVWVEPGTGSEGFSVVHFPETLEVGGFALDSSPEPFDPDSGPAGHALRRLAARAAAPPAPAALSVLPPGGSDRVATSDCGETVASLSACIKKGLAYKEGKVTFAASPRDNGWCLKGSNWLADPDGFTRSWLVPDATPIWIDNGESVRHDFIYIDRAFNDPNRLMRYPQLPAETADWQCPTASMTVHYFVFLAKDSDGKNHQVVLLHLEGAANPKGNASRLARDSWQARMWTLSGVRVSVAPKWKGAPAGAERAGLNSPKSSPSNFNLNNQETEITATSEYSLGFEGTLKGECTVGGEAKSGKGGKKKNTEPAPKEEQPKVGQVRPFAIGVEGECGVGGEATATGSLSWKFSETRKIKDWKALNDSNHADYKFAWVFSQNRPYDGYPRPRHEASNDAYNWFVVPQSIKEFPELSKYMMDFSGFAAFDVDADNVGRQLQVDLGLDFSLDATLCGPRGNETCWYNHSTNKATGNLRTVLKAGHSFVIDLGHMSAR